MEPYLPKRLTHVSPERPLPRPGSHRRMQSLQSPSVRERGFMIEGVPSSPLSPEKSTRPTTPIRHRDSRESFCSSMFPDKDSQRGSFVPGPSLTPIARPAVRWSDSQSILGENTPPQSATMLALQNMPAPVPKEAETQTQTPPPQPAASALSDVTNGSTPAPRSAPDQEAGGALSGQIVALTNIATALQKEMSALSRRSRDNATDLMSLKQATTSRDEDIRKTLRDLMGNLNEKKEKDPFYNGLFLEGKAHNLHASPPSSSARSAKPFSLPRIPSPNSFAASIDRESVSTPSMSAADAPATIALLEKIIRDMGTREGQDLLITRLTEVAEKLAGMASATKVEELLRMIKQHPTVVGGSAADGSLAGSRAGSRQMSYDDGTYDRSLDMEARGQDDHGSSALRPGVSDLINEDVLKIIRSVKDSVAQGGGLTAEVKALVRELRGEVLGMGRELRCRLDDMGTEEEGAARSFEQQDEMKRVIHQGLDELKDQMDGLLHEHRRQSSGSAASHGSHVDYQEIYNAMRVALKDSKASESQLQEHLSREDVIDAVREVWENYKPEVEVQQYGLERDEILACLQEGLQSHAPRDDQAVGATREEVFRAVVEGLKHFSPPQMETPASLSRDEVLEAVRECLEEFEFPLAPSALGNDLSRDDMVQAVKDGLHDFDFPTSSRALAVSQPGDEAVMQKLAEIIELMRLEFRSVSDEARENVAANGRDTEQVLDATKDGFERLRKDMEEYVDKISGMSSRGDSSEQVVDALDDFRDEISQLLESRMDSIRDSVNMSLVPASSTQNPMKDGLESIREGLDRLRGELQRPLAGTTEILDAIQEGMTDLHTRIEKLGNRPPDLTANDEILDALKTGLDGVRSEMEGIRGSQDHGSGGNNARALAAFGDIGPDGDGSSGDGLRHDDIKNLEDMIAQLRVKVEAMADEPRSQGLSKDDLSHIELTLGSLKEAVEGIPKTESRSLERGGSAITPDTDLKEDVQAIETILRNTKARLDDVIEGEQAVRKDDVDRLEAMIIESRDSLGLITTQMGDAARQADITKLESLIGNLATAYEEMKAQAGRELQDPERVTKTDVGAVEAVCLDVKGLVNELAKADITALPTKDDLNSIIADLTERVDSVKETTSTAVATRDAETIDVNERIKEVREILTEFQDLTQLRLEDGVMGVEAAGKLLDQMSEVAEGNTSVGAELRDMIETMKLGFEESQSGVAGMKLDTEEKFQQGTDSLASKIDERIDELVSRYGELQTSLEEQAKTAGEREEATEAAVVGTKVVAEELKLLIDTLGSTVTETLERTEEASKTVFTRVEDLVTNTGENHTENKTEHEQTRERVAEALAVMMALKEPVAEMQPKVLEAVKELLEPINEHYEYAKTSAAELQQKVEDSKPEKYDDSGVQEKLDKLVGHNETTDEALSQLDAALTEKFESIASNTGEKLDTLVTGNEALDAFVKEKLETLLVNSEATGETVTQFDSSLKEKLEALAASNTERLDGILVNTEATGEAFSQFDTSVKEKLDGFVSTTTEKLEGILVNTEATGEGFSQLDASIKERLETILSNTGATTESFSQLDELLKERFDKVLGNTDSAAESFSQLDEFLKEKFDKLLGNNDSAAESFSQLDEFLKERLDKILGNTGAATESFSQLDEFLKEKLERLVDHSDANGESLSQLDTDLKERLEKLSEQTLTAGKAFDQLDGSMGGKLDQLIDHTHSAGRTFAQMDSSVQGKLDTLVDHSQSTGQALERLEALDKIHGQVVATAASISTFLAGQKQRISDENEERERAAQEAAVLLERRTSEKERVVESISVLREEEARLKEGVLGLRSENEGLAKQRTRLAADVSSLETALRLRKEELGEMEERAEGLERRILEGVMNHSRVLLMSKNQGSESMSRKRVRIKGDGAREAAKKPAVNVALSAKRSLGPQGGSPASAGRRIVSLSQITNNVPTGGFKRSHSVKGPTGGGRGAARKGSWGGAGKGYGELDKENVVDVKEVKEEEAPRAVSGGGPGYEAGMQLVPLKERDLETEAEVEREMTGMSARSSGRTLHGDEEDSDGMETESEADFVSVADGGASDRDDASVTDSAYTRDDDASFTDSAYTRDDASVTDSAYSRDDVSTTNDGGSDRDEVSSAGTLRRSSRATDVSSSFDGTEYSEDYDDDEYTGSEGESDITESAVGTTLSGMTVGNEVAVVQ